MTRTDLKTPPANPHKHDHGLTATDKVLAAHSARMDAIEKDAAVTKALLIAAIGSGSFHPPVVVPPEVGDFYGMGMGFDALANIRTDNDPTKSFMRFRSPFTSNINSVRWYFLSTDSGSGYGGGTGGTMTVSIQTDSGGYPSGTILASKSIAASATGVTGRLTTFDTPAALTAGTLYHVVFHNTDASPATNYFSPDFGWQHVPDSPLNPRFADGSFAVGYNEGGSWSLRSGFWPIMDLGFDAGHWGSGYMEISYGAGEVGEITGTSKMVRERIVVSGGNRTVSAVGIRALRESGTGNLTATLRNSAGTSLATASLPYGSFSTGDETNYDTNGAGAYVKADLTTSVELVSGSTYYLEFSAAAGTTYWAFAIRRGSDYGYDAATYFSDGVAQKTTNGSTWSSLGRVADENDLQLYFEVA